MFSRKSGFTVMELLIVVAIIGVLASIAIVTTSHVRARARDSKRVFDTQQIMTALEAYYNRNHFYPTYVTFGEALSDERATYLSAIPNNPEPRNDGDCSNNGFKYEIDPDNATYRLTFCLGNDSGRLDKGINVCTNGACVSGGKLTVEDNDGNVYNTVSVGGQLWLAENLRSKTKPNGSCINGGSAPCADASVDDPGNSPRLCYNNTEENCVANGALYTWAAVMDGSSAEGAQGICPNGWHVPSDADWHALELYLTDSGQLCDPAHATGNCESAGIKLGQGGSSGMNIIPAGYHTGIRFFNGNSFNDAASIWSSTADGGDAWIRGLVKVNATGLFEPTVGRGTLPQTDQASLRCIKNI